MSKWTLWDEGFEAGLRSMLKILNQEDYINNKTVGQVTVAIDKAAAMRRAEDE